MTLRFERGLTQARLIHLRDQLAKLQAGNTFTQLMSGCVSSTRD